MKLGFTLRFKGFYNFSKMDYNYLFHICVLWISLFSSVSLGQTVPPLAVRFEDATPVNASLDSSVHFKCHVNRDPFFGLNNPIQMVHIHPITGVETIMTEGGSPKAGAQPSFYTIKVGKGDGVNDVAADFEILKVREQDDGIFRCRIVSGVPGDEHKEIAGHVDRHILVYRPMDSLTLKIGDLSYDKNPMEPLKLDSGEYKVDCIAEGSNPEAEVNLDFHGVAIEGSSVEASLMEHKFRRYRTTSSASLNLMVSNSGQELSCFASDESGTKKSLKIAIEVNIYDPTIVCNDTDAFVGQSNPILTCVVNYTNMDVTGFAFQIGDTGEIIKKGEKNAQNMAVSVIDIEDGISEVSLDLHKAEHKYLNKNYYVLIDMKGGHTSKESVRLNSVQDEDEGSGPAGNGERIYPAISLYLVLLLACIWNL